MRAPTKRWATHRKRDGRCTVARPAAPGRTRAASFAAEEPVTARFRRGSDRKLWDDQVDTVAAAELLVWDAAYIPAGSRVTVDGVQYEVRATSESRSRDGRVLFQKLMLR